MGYLKHKAKKKAEKAALNPTANTKERRGHIYDWLMDNPQIRDGMETGALPLSYGATLANCTEAALTRSLQAWRTTKALDAKSTEWVMSWKARAMLPVDAMENLKNAEPGSDEFERALDHLTRAYSVFSRYYFTLEGKRPLIMGFHLKWIRSIIAAWATGGKQMILSPPRHGKSEMLIRFVVWFIVMNPNIRIGWFCAGTDVAKIMLGAVRDHLENNERLLADTLPPGVKYRPKSRGLKPWSAKEIKVEQQSHVGAKSSSLLALGLTSKFLSRDMDLIIIDDPEDFDSTAEEGQRKKARGKLGEIGTRKEEHTAMCYISSRQHPDDIPNYILGLEESELSWHAIVDSAHAQECDEDPEDYEAHTDCLLFPQVRSYRWLMEKKLEMESLDIGHAFSMRYLNRPIPEDGQVFDMKLIRENALDRTRGIGLDDLPLGRLAAGLDPSPRGVQAAFLWHYNQNEEKLSMVDMETQDSGGMAGAHRIIRLWHDKYGLDLWFYEDNSQQVEFFRQKETKDLIAELGITIKPFRTGKNKMDPEMGITSMAPWYHNGRISLPYGTREAVRKVNQLMRQLELWTVTGVTNKRAKTDIKMASWFPFPYFVNLIRRNRKPVVHESQDYTYSDTGYKETPWASTYPGGS